MRLNAEPQQHHESFKQSRVVKNSDHIRSSDLQVLCSAGFLSICINHSTVKAPCGLWSTPDIRTIFTHKVKAINPDTGKEEDGHWCEVCKANGVARKFSFLKGSVTSLRAHIRRHKDHTKLYKDRCRKHGIQPHMRALPSDDMLRLLAHWRRLPMLSVGGG
ncbi:hypothetical protein BDR03DRAFT_1010983 [Suillus americanus]|nr:hypothetical protein BDR03DRAFT_1010983 [Suillus americanus]